jgi:hypothetical protein
LRQALLRLALHAQMLSLRLAFPLLMLLPLSGIRTRHSRHARCQHLSMRAELTLPVLLARIPPASVPVPVRPTVLPLALIPPLVLSAIVYIRTAIVNFANPSPCVSPSLQPPS